jgi:hypothetical protein
MLVWICDKCGKREPYESTGDVFDEAEREKRLNEYSAEDEEPCLDCADGTVTLEEVSQP